MTPVIYEDGMVEKYIIHFNNDVEENIEISFCGARATMFGNFTTGRGWRSDGNNGSSIANHNENYPYGWHFRGLYSSGDKIDEHVIIEDIENVYGRTPVEITLVCARKKRIKIVKMNEKLFFLNNVYTKDRIYEGKNSYHSSHDVTNWYNKPLKPQPVLMGMEAECIAINERAAMELEKFKSNIVFFESDPSLGSSGFEGISIPLNPKDAMNPSFWRPYENMINLFAYAFSNINCGCHIHIGNEIFGSDEDEIKRKKGELVFFYEIFLRNVDFNDKINGRTFGYKESIPDLKVAKSAMLFGQHILKNKDIQKNIIDEIYAYSKSHRCMDINLQPEKTIEFRKGKGSLNADRIANYFTYYYYMCKYIDATEWYNLSTTGFINFMQTHLPNSSLLKRIFFPTGEKIE